MAQVFSQISDEQRDFIAAQPLFFVASAPQQGHINLSPKGLDTFRVLSPQQVAYLDLTGSGNETSAHLHENGRITLMFCAFQEPPQILRLYGRGRVVLPGSVEWDGLFSLFSDIPGARQIIVADIERVQTSCGYAVPLMELRQQRLTLVTWANRKGSAGLAKYHHEKNRRSIDGLITHLGSQD